MLRNPLKIINQGFLTLGLCLILGIGHRAFGYQNSQLSTECDGDTVDRMGSDLARESREFLKQLKTAALSNRKTKVAGMVHYPLKVFVDNSMHQIRSPAEFVSDYERIVTPHVKKALLDQSVKCLFGNTDGFMVGDGEIWFTEVSKS